MAHMDCKTQFLGTQTKKNILKNIGKYKEKIERWKLELQEFNIEYINRKQNIITDDLRRDTNAITKHEKQFLEQKLLAFHINFGIQAKVQPFRH